jgi:hypothetical protein
LEAFSILALMLQASDAGRYKARAYKMSEVFRFRSQAGSDEMIAKLVKAGYLRPEQRHDADAITIAIALLKQDLRRSGNSGDGPAAA